MTVQWIDRTGEELAVPEGASTTRLAKDDFRLPSAYVEAVRKADLAAEFARFADDAFEWAEASLPVAAIRDEE